MSPPQHTETLSAQARNIALDLPTLTRRWLVSVHTAPSILICPSTGMSCQLRGAIPILAETSLIRVTRAAYSIGSGDPRPRLFLRAFRPDTTSRVATAHLRCVSTRPTRSPRPCVHRTQRWRCACTRGSSARRSATTLERRSASTRSHPCDRVRPGKDAASIRFRVTLDVQEPGADHGADTDAAGYGMVTENRLYQLVRQQSAIRDRTFRIEFLVPGVQAYSFTFG